MGIKQRLDKLEEVVFSAISKRHMIRELTKHNKQAQEVITGLSKLSPERQRLFWEMLRQELKKFR
jgi:hypothetical protein